MPYKDPLRRKENNRRDYLDNLFARLMYRQLTCLSFPRKIRQQDKQSRLRRFKKNPSKFRLQRKTSYYKHHDRNLILKRVAGAKWRKLNPEAMRAATRKWAQAHPEQCLARAHKRRAIKLGATCGDTALIVKIYARAKELRQWFNVVVDHIIPLAKGGAHAPENLQIIYAKENASKGARLEFVPSVVFV